MKIFPLILAVLCLSTATSWKLVAEPVAASVPAVSSQAVALQPDVPARLKVPPSQETKEGTDPPPSSPTPVAGIDPLLDPERPRNCQLTIDQEQRVRCGTTEVILPPGVYRQVTVVESPEGRRAAESTGLKPQHSGLGYLRYLAEGKVRIGGVERTGGLDVGIRAEDRLPVRVWYKKMTEPDDVTKAFSFLLPPVALIAGAGAWSSGNILFPEPAPVFTEARDYYLRKHEPAASTVHPAFRSRPGTPTTPPGFRNNR